MIDIILYTLLAVVELNSYTRAAEHLSLTQPAVTQHIKQLEKELNVKIFNRVGKEIKPTNEGNIVIQYARRNIALYERMFFASENSSLLQKVFPRHRWGLFMLT